MSGGDAGNYTVSQPSGLTADITAASLDIYATTDSKSYDRTTSSTATPTTSGLQTGDTVPGLTQAFQSKNVLGVSGSTLQVTAYTVNDGNSGNNYSVATHTATGTITAVSLDIYATTDSKSYDGNTSSSATPTTSGLQTGDTVTGLTQAFQSKNVLGVNGSTLQVTAYTVNDGNSGNNYSAATHTATGTITAKNLTISGAVANSKQYDGNILATVNFGGASLVGVIGLDVVTINSSGYTANFNNKNVGNGKPVTVIGVILSGGDAGNYTVSQPGGLTANITTLHITGTFTAGNKLYNGNNSATVLVRSLVGAISGDLVSLTGGTATFSDKNVGNGKTVTLTGASLSGADAGNYALDSVATTTANITVLHITGTFTAANKVYDGTTTATVLTRSLVGTISGDLVSLTGGTATFSDKNVGNGKTVTLTGATLTGTDAGNYGLDSVATTTANITPASLTITATNRSKVFGVTYTPVTTYPSPDFTITGTIYSGDSVTSITLTCAGYAAGATVTTPGPTYPIVPINAVGTGLGNYAILYVNGTFTINAWTETGFYQPVDMGGVVNTVKGGSTVPLKFNIYAGGVERTNVTDVQYQSVQFGEYTCGGSNEVPLEEVANTGSTNLRYDTTGHQFIQNWQTPKPPNKCYVVRMTAIDGSSITAYIKTK